MRFVCQRSSLYEDRDYLFYCDIDMLFVSDVDKEVLPDESGMVGVEHPGFYGGRRGTYDDNPKSTAFVKNNEGKIYYAGGFNWSSNHDDYRSKYHN